MPGFFGSLAAAPQVPGFSFGNILYYSQVSAGGNVAFAKQVPLGNIKRELQWKLECERSRSRRAIVSRFTRLHVRDPCLGRPVQLLHRVRLWTNRKQRRRDDNGQPGLGRPGIYDWA